MGRFEGEEAEWAETVKQLIKEASNLPGQREESIQCKRCGKERIVLNQQNWERECKELGRDCREPADTGIRRTYIHKESK